MRGVLLAVLIMHMSVMRAQLPEPTLIVNQGQAVADTMISQARQCVHSNPDSAKWFFKKAWSVSHRMDYRYGASSALANLGYMFSGESQYDSARKYYFMALVYLDTLKDSVRVSKLFNSIGVTYAKQLKFYPAISAYVKAADFGIASSYERAAAYCNMGTTLSFIDQFDKALHYFNQALPLLIASGDTSNWCGTLMNIGNVYNRIGIADSAIYFLDSALSMAIRHNLTREFVTIAVNLSDFYLERKQRLKALNVLEKSLTFGDSASLQNRERNMLLIQSGRVYAALGQFTAAVGYLQSALDDVKGDTHHTMLILNALANLYEMSGEYKSAFNFSRAYYTLRDSVSSRETQGKAQELETRYRTLQKDKEIAEGQLRIKEQEQRLSNQLHWVGGTISVSLFVLLLASWRYTHMRQKNRRLQSQMEVEQLKSEMAGEQKERARIASELHDGIVAELTAIKMNLEVSGNRLPEAPLAYRTHLKELSTVINEVRNTAHNLMPEILLKHGLAEAVGLLCETLEKTGRLEMDYQHYGDFTAVSQPMRQSVYRIIQELLHNIIKHAQASKALLQLSSNDGLLSIELEDDGVGMKARSHGSMGLSNIERRVKELRGRVAWSSPAAGSGTQVHLEFEV